MDLLASYDDDGEKPSSSQNDNQEKKGITSNSLQAEWESFEKMIAGEGIMGGEPVSTEQFLQSGVVAYPGLFKSLMDHVDESKDSDEEKTEESKKSKSSLADDVMKLLGSNFTEELDEPRRARSRSSSHSSHSSESSGSRSPSHSPEHKSSPQREEENLKEKNKSPSRSPPHLEKETDIKRPSKKRRSRSRSLSRRKKSPHSRRRSRSSRSRSRRRSQDRKHSSSHKRHRRSRSRSQDRRHKRGSRSSRDGHRHRRDRKRRSRSRERMHKKSRRSRSRHRSRSRSRHRSRSRSPHKHSRHGKSRSRSRDRAHRKPERTVTKPEEEKHLTFKEKMRAQLLKASKYLQAGEGVESEGAPREKPSNLPLSDGHKKFFQALASSTSSSVTPQMALLHTMAAMHQKAQEMTGVAVPKYYNPAAVNPLKYAEQVQKRKLLWSKNKEKKEDKEKEWQNTAFNADENGKMAQKFRKLMGIKHGEGEDGEGVTELSEEQKKKREEFFSRLDKDYEFARITTHTQRGVGLGFSSAGIQPP